MKKFIAKLFSKKETKPIGAIPIGGINITEQCNLSCVMCHFNGPGARRRFRSLTLAQTQRFLSGVHPGQDISFAGTGEILTAPEMLSHIRLAVEFGHRPSILTNGTLLTPEICDQLLDAGVRKFTISTDAYTYEDYAAIRRGGDFRIILAAFEYLRKQKQRFNDLVLESNNVLLFGEMHKILDYCEFWKGKIDQVNFFSEYYDTFHFRNTLCKIPRERCDCELALYLMPSGYISPCCAINIIESTENIDWLPHIDKYEPAAALQYLESLYSTSGSPLRNICEKCNWWMMFYRNEYEESPVSLSIALG